MHVIIDTRSWSESSGLLQVKTQLTLSHNCSFWVNFNCSKWINSTNICVEVVWDWDLNFQVSSPQLLQSLLSHNYYNLCQNSILCENRQLVDGPWKKWESQSRGRRWNLHRLSQILKTDLGRVLISISGSRYWKFEIFEIDFRKEGIASW